MRSAPVADNVPRLKVEGLVKSFFEVTVLHGLSFELQPGELLGFVGENGSGKSTTMNLLTGVLPKDAGRIFLDGELFEPANRSESDALGIAFTQQELNIFPNLSVAENLFLGRYPRMMNGAPIISRRKMRARANQLLRAVDLEVDPDEPAERLSAGERQLVEIARGLANDIKVLILDEPTTSLTARETSRLFEIIARLKRQGVSIIYISHALDDVLKLSDRVLVMRDGRQTLCAPREGLTADQLVVAMVGRTIDALYPERPTAEVDGAAPILEVEGVSEPGAVRDISFQLRKGEIVGISGLMGSGRSRLARILFGVDPHREGTIRAGGQNLNSADLKARLDAGFAFVTEDRRQDSLLMDATVAENMALAALPRYTHGFCRRISRSALSEAIEGFAAKMSIRGGDLNTTPIRALSGGNQQKAILSRWLSRDPTIFILDEPTRGIDVGAKEEIYRLLAQLAQQGAAILVISSEIEELIGLCDRIMVMHRGQLEDEFDRKEFDRESILRAAFGRTFKS